MASHRELSPDQCRSMGISPSLLRLSVGIEHPADLAADLLAALDLLETPAVYTPAAHQRDAANDRSERVEEPAP